jgi:uncharacterized RDD family membrane protein YckC
MRVKVSSRTTRLSIFVIDILSFFILVLIIFSAIKEIQPKFQSFIIDNNRFIAFILYFSYYFIFEFAFSATIGKLITKTKVVDSINLSKPSILKIFFRTLCRFIPLEAFYVLINENKLTLHDLLSKTTVIHIS